MSRSAEPRRNALRRSAVLCCVGPPCPGQAVPVLIHLPSFVDGQQATTDPCERGRLRDGRLVPRVLRGVSEAASVEANAEELYAA